MLSTLMTSFRLWRIKREIKRLERYETELKHTLRAVQNEVLPELRTRRNRLMYGPPLVR